MAHQIDQSTGKAAVFVTGEPAWHRLGTVVENAVNSVEAIKLAGLDWEVEQWPVRAFNPDQPGVEASCPGRVANVRTDTKATLGIVSTSYEVFQNREAFEFMDSLVADRLCMYETAGALFGGRQVWMMARIPSEYRVGGDDVVKPYILLSNSHDGSRALRVFPTAVRVVCNNTLTLAMKGAGESSGLTIYHMGNLQDRIRQAREILGICAARFDQFDAEMHKLIERDLTDAETAEYFESVLPKSDSKLAETFRAKTLAAFNDNLTSETNTLDGMIGTAWAAYNAVSEYADHQSRATGKPGHEQDSRRFNSVFVGKANHMKQRAWANALELVK